MVFCCCVALFSLVTDWDFLLRWIMEMLMRERPPPPLLFLLEEGEAWLKPALLVGLACWLCEGEGRCGCLGLASRSRRDMDTALPAAVLPLGVADREPLFEDEEMPDIIMEWVMVGMRSVRRRAALGGGAEEGAAQKLWDIRPPPPESSPRYGIVRVGLFRSL